jgi:hypothetical protein
MPSLFKQLNQPLHQPLFNSDAKGEPRQKSAPFQTIPSTVPPVQPLFQSPGGLGYKNVTRRN